MEFIRDVAEIWNNNAGAVQIVATLGSLIVAAVLVLVTIQYARDSSELANATKRLAEETALMARATEDMAKGSRDQLRELINHRNLLERQLHKQSLDEIREASEELMRTYTDAVTKVRVARRNVDWQRVMTRRAFSLPPEVQDQLRPGMSVSDDLITRIDELTPQTMEAVSEAIALSALSVADHYLAFPGRPFGRPLPLPEVGSDFDAWLREHQD